MSESIVMEKSAKKKQQVKKDEKQQLFQIKQFYLKEVNFEALTPMHLIGEQWQPEAKMDLDVGILAYDNNHYAVELKILVNVSMEKPVFNLKLTHGGIFEISGYDDASLRHLLNSFCANTIFPYARQVVTQITAQAGYPALNLAPFDFEGRFHALAEQEKAKKEEKEKS